MIKPACFLFAVLAVLAFALVLPTGAVSSDANGLTQAQIKDAVDAEVANIEALMTSDLDGDSAAGPNAGSNADSATDSTTDATPERNGALPAASQFRTSSFGSSFTQNLIDLQNSIRNKAIAIYLSALLGVTPEKLPLSVKQALMCPTLQSRVVKTGNKVIGELKYIPALNASASAFYDDNIVANATYLGTFKWVYPAMKTQCPILEFASMKNDDPALYQSNGGSLMYPMSIMKFTRNMLVPWLEQLLGFSFLDRRVADVIPCFQDKVSTFRNVLTTTSPSIRFGRTNPLSIPLLTTLDIIRYNPQNIAAGFALLEQSVCAAVPVTDTIVLKSPGNECDLNRTPFVVGETIMYNVQFGAAIVMAAIPHLNQNSTTGITTRDYVVAMERLFGLMKDSYEVPQSFQLSLIYQLIKISGGDVNAISARGAASELYMQLPTNDTATWKRCLALNAGVAGPSSTCFSTVVGTQTQLYTDALYPFVESFPPSNYFNVHANSDVVLPDVHSRTNSRSIVEFARVLTDDCVIDRYQNIRLASTQRCNEFREKAVEGFDKGTLPYMVISKIGMTINSENFPLGKSPNAVGKNGNGGNMLISSPSYAAAYITAYENGFNDGFQMSPQFRRAHLLFLDKEPDSGNWYDAL